MIYKFLLHFKSILDKNLNEYIKWVILLGLYGFYRMMAAAIEENHLRFLGIPLIALSLLIFTIDWILPLLTTFFNPGKKQTTPGRYGLIVLLFLILGLAGFLLFYITDYIPWVNLGFLGWLSAALTALWVRKDIFSYFALLLWVFGLTGMVFSFVQNNGIPVVSAICYLGFTTLYFIRLIKKPVRAQK